MTYFSKEWAGRKEALRPRYFGLLKPSSPVILLTGNELFSSRISEMWKNKGGVYEKFNQRAFELRDLENLADATQQIYLQFPSWSTYWHSEWEKKRQKYANKKTAGKGKNIDS